MEVKKKKQYSYRRSTTKESQESGSDGNLRRSENSLAYTDRGESMRSGNNVKVSKTRIQKQMN